MVVSNIFYFHPYLGKVSNLTNIFQIGWNHQPAITWCWQKGFGKYIELQFAKPRISGDDVPNPRMTGASHLGWNRGWMWGGVAHVIVSMTYWKSLESNQRWLIDWLVKLIHLVGSTYVCIVRTFGVITTFWKWIQILPFNMGVLATSKTV